MTVRLSPEQAYLAMFCFLDSFYKRTGSDDVGALLGSMSLLNDGRPMDSALWGEWLESVAKSLEQEVDASLTFVQEQSQSNR
ncbi:hypothetical protein QTA57_10945 [Fontisubflavum oceani]|uniref:hypothetical protein n=1 Tax=Fontisubflavum oceani TaxID=2978973 RepID=UPI0025B5A332|nr:hypothetical protein [Fontisubflavum oceani]WJY20383.1 hypothetical protein QTA57_10945 [Fontisubflavum oceani]